MAEDVLDVVDAAYQLECDEGEWLERVARAVHAQLDRGLGVVSFLYRIHGEGRVEVQRALMLDVPREYAALVPQIPAGLPPEYVRATFGKLPCATASHSGPAEARPWVRRQMHEAFGALGWRDLFIVNGLDPTGHGVYVAAARARAGQLSAGQRTRWTRAAVHLAAASRLRRRLQGVPGAAAPDAAEAVLTPDGELAHARAAAKTKEAREALRHAVRTIERARHQRRRNHSDRMVAEWTGLVAARWSLLDHFESSGRRYLVARRNDVVDVAEADLSERERQAVAFAALGHNNKLIAYEMGISAATVGVLLHRAARKLGARTRAQLLALARLRFTLTP